jgi:hypothetical protein
MCDLENEQKTRSWPQFRDIFSPYRHEQLRAAFHFSARLQASMLYDVNSTQLNDHHDYEHNQGLGLKTCSFKAQGVLGISILF